MFGLGASYDESFVRRAVQGRIGPYMFEGMQVGPKRIWLPSQDLPGLSMTRAMGDQLGASVGVSAEPEITQVRSRAVQGKGSSVYQQIAKLNVYSQISLNGCLVSVNFAPSDRLLATSEVYVRIVLQSC